MAPHPLSSNTLRVSAWPALDELSADETDFLPRLHTLPRLHADNDDRVPLPAKPLQMPPAPGLSRLRPDTAMRRQVLARLSAAERSAYRRHARMVAIAYAAVALLLVWIAAASAQQGAELEARVAAAPTIAVAAPRTDKSVGLDAMLADPAVRAFVGLSENDWDFSRPHTIPGFGPLETPAAR